ncbi:pre-mRNA-splicing factor cwc21 [Grosmannia clavigera kw1407]|uniref:Pre-mRNA-splicing factor cwc21 n=1 Tax=Grosmannia clavigera (strain kw1407 / UAMH 11150) TaxID=655863 RepID=F0XUG5_GROCL|nr:pre-mRNA-splicing factor cwc21 [Grosmannia clavigera kw1407]EFW98505.1 pre-mRNA-splicing factor cwc21 [Grosmannia clavigera kw1407]
MSDNVGLSTPRGSGTSGFVQRNRAYMQPRDHVRSNANPRDFLDSEAQKARLRKPDQGILDHDRKRVVEVRVFALRDELEDKDVDEAEIERRCDELRKSLTAAAERPGRAGGADNGAPRRFKAHQVHEQARAKAEESERLRRALHISKDYEEGGHWRRQDEKQELKRKKEEDEAERERERERQRDAAERRRRHHHEDPPVRSVEKPSHDIDDDDGDNSDNNSNNHRDDRSDLEEGEYDDRDRGRQDGRRVRQRRGSSPGRDSRSRSRSHSHSHSRRSSKDSS